MFILRIIFPCFTDLSQKNGRPGWEGQPVTGKTNGSRGPAAVKTGLWGDQKVGVPHSFSAAAQRTAYNVMALPSRFFSLPFFSDKV